MKSAVMLCMFIVTAPVHGQTTSPSDEALRVDLIRRIQSFNADDPAIRSFDINGTFGDLLISKARFRACFEAPNQRAIYIYSAIDNTPLAALVNGNLAIYDAGRRTVTRTNIPATSVTLRLADEKFSFRFSARSAENPDEPSEFVFDLRSLFTDSSSALTMDRVAHQVYRLKSVGPKESAIEATIDLSLDPDGSCRQMVLRAESGAHVMTIDGARLNGPMDARLFEPPGIEGFPTSLRVEERPFGDELNAGMARLREVVVGVASRAAIYDPELRKLADEMEQEMLKEFGSMGLLDPREPADWDLAKRVDEEASPMLRERWGAPLLEPSPVPEPGPSTGATKRD